MGDFRVITPDYVSLQITMSGDSFVHATERRFPKSITIAELKGKMELLTGASAATMSLEVYNKDNVLVCKLDNNDMLLGSYHVDSDMRLHVVDKFILRNEFENTSKVEKYDIPKEEYDKREGTVKSFLQKNKLGKYNAEEMAAREEARRKAIEEQIQTAKKFNIGDRCEISVPGQPRRRGTIKYVGEIDGKPGWWVGVHYDEPLGRHNGTIDGKKYFECPDKYGAIIKPNFVEVGDFPEEDTLDEEI